MKIPPQLVVRSAIATSVAPVDCEPGVYRVEVMLDGVREVFHIELEGEKSSFTVRERSFGQYCLRSPTLKGIIALMREWHSGHHRDLPADLADVDFV